MGDNMYLGDRNGVRTPMQWSPDRNGGFSAANPQRLFLPLIMDPEYHYESVNVENQERNLSSLLWWFRRRLALRQRFPAFGAGTLEFLQPDNLKLLCFLRRHGEDVILVAVNLSESPQVTTLDLRAYDGYKVEEISSLSRFPSVTSEPYPLMLGPYGYYWLLLKPALAPAPGPEPERILAMNPSNWTDLLQGRGKEMLEAEVLPAYLPRCRWFGGKSRSIRSVEIQDRVLPPDGGDWAMILLHVEYADSGPETYLLPLARGDGDAAAAVRAEAPNAILTELSGGDAALTGDRAAILYEAVYHPGFRSRMLGLIAGGGAWPGLNGVLRGSARSEVFKDRMPDPSDESKVLKADQSNTAILFPGRHFVKFLRRLEEGENPELEILRFFEEHTSFRNVPSYVGAIEYASGRQCHLFHRHRPGPGRPRGRRLVPCPEAGGRLHEPHRGSPGPPWDPCLRWNFPPATAASRSRACWAAAPPRCTWPWPRARTCPPSPPNPFPACTSARSTKACVTRWPASTSACQRPCPACPRRRPKWAAKSRTTARS